MVIVCSAYYRGIVRLTLVHPLNLNQLHESRMALLGFAVCICMMKSFDFLRINRSFSTTTFIIMGMLRKVGLGYTTYALLCCRNTNFPT